MSHTSVFPSIADWAELARRSAGPPWPSTIVAIPCRDEAARIEACLDALDSQVEGSMGSPLEPASLGVVVLLNNCLDDTAARVGARAAGSRHPIWAVDRRLPSDFAHAGAARRLALDAAAGWLKAGASDDGVMLTTDADTRVAPTWVSRQRALFARGFDAVAGYVETDSEEYQLLPAALRFRGGLEDSYARLMAELASLIDPQPFDPFPCHAMASGASLGVRRDVYVALGGAPVVPVGEDRALMTELVRRDAVIRHPLDVRVTTSCRLAGRAAGGMADTLRHRIEKPDAACDEGLEPVEKAVRRFGWRAALRARHAAGKLRPDGRWTESLRIPRQNRKALAELQRFGELWYRIERLSPLLRPGGLHPQDLPTERERAEYFIADLRRMSRPASPANDDVPDGAGLGSIQPREMPA